MGYGSVSKPEVGGMRWSEDKTRNYPTKKEPLNQVGLRVKMSRCDSMAERENGLETDVAAHVEDALTLPGDGDEVAVDGIEILGQVEVVGIGDVGQVRGVQVQRAPPDTPADEVHPD